MPETRTAFGFSRTECDCEECVLNCRYIPGYLIPSDLENIVSHLGYDDLLRFAMENLMASPGATVMADGQVFQIPTLVPQRQSDGACKFLGENNRCSIHAASPFGCAYFDCHQSRCESDRRSIAGLHAIAREWEVGGLYARVWMVLFSAGLIALSPAEAKKRMKASFTNAC
ncbi:MAG TPA: hypothetical protein VFD58_18115 [Blastocatellia bacterium]|nr:hypothetical protein [Blastocatellia bacterium]